MIKIQECVYQSFSCVQPHGILPTRFLWPWNSKGKNIGMGCHSLLQGIFLTQRSNPGILHCRQTPYHLSHQGSQKYKNTVVYFCYLIQIFFNNSYSLYWLIFFQYTLLFCYFRLCVVFFFALQFSTVNTLFFFNLIEG